MREDRDGVGFFDKAKPVNPKKQKNKPSDDTGLRVLAVKAALEALRSQTPGAIIPVPDGLRPQDIPIPPVPDHTLRRRYALEMAMRLAMGQTMMSPFGSSHTADTLPPQDVVKVAREIDRFLAGD